MADVCQSFFYIIGIKGADMAKSKLLFEPEIWVKELKKHYKKLGIKINKV